MIRNQHVEEYIRFEKHIEAQLNRALKYNGGNTLGKYDIN